MVELVKFANTFPQMWMVFDFTTHVGGHAWRNIVTNIIADSERYGLTSVTKLTVVKLSFRHVVVICVLCRIWWGCERVRAVVLVSQWIVEER